MSRTGTIRIDRVNSGKPDDHIAVVFHDPASGEDLVCRVGMTAWSQAIAGLGMVPVTYEVVEREAVA